LSVVAECAEHTIRSVDEAVYSRPLVRPIVLKLFSAVLGGWQPERKRPVNSLAYWDAIGALSNPLDIDWLAEAISTFPTASSRGASTQLI
jgi:hypothetical protein